MTNISKKDIIKAFEKAELYKIADNIKSCGKHYFVKDDKHINIKCKNKFCPNCSKLKNLTLQKEIQKVATLHLHNNKYLIASTLSIIDQENLQNSLNIINNAWQQFYKNDRQCAKEFKHTFVGGVKSIEITTDKSSKLWHINLHLIFIKDHFSYDHAFIKGAWTHCVKKVGGNTNDENIKCETIHLKDNAHWLASKNYLINHIKGMSKLMKIDYQNISIYQLQELEKALKSFRQFDAFGCCKNIEKSLS